MQEKEAQWFYHPTTGEVTQGLGGSWTDRMGPYATREEAEQALEKAAQRNDAYDAQDDDWD
ncbi:MULTISPECIES: SPOR domain-containing protein [unclassified Corynebacterium]|uniref:SPOR domain-containing protein n=1 Tax=unclassified Corynebacterium TaxID=2624378 RepID=UPI0029CA9DCD|nr:MULTISPECIES: SPOR domain-containing protein [unclassified Corynebacterium]WPF65507.1 SPOR domain-containing protein [Corynebacterium sp. 22KM0430]WPF68003.1 SPOR domain-containing protein [Corynebacterium sp. 21KM1197]